jgi:hypothetical protein
MCSLLVKNYYYIYKIIVDKSNSLIVHSTKKHAYYFLEKLHNFVAIFNKVAYLQMA